MEQAPIPSSGDTYPAPDTALVAALEAALTTTAAGTWHRIEAEWSQAGTQHSGRMHVTDAGGDHRMTMPDDAVAAFSDLRAQMRTPATGCWLSARLDIAAGQAPVFTPNYTLRPAWNSPARSMLEPLPPPVIPSEQAWLSELRRNPRDRAHMPTWLAQETVAGEASAGLRAALDRRGHPRRAVSLPQESATPFEGALEILSYSPAHHALQITDYGQRHLLGEYWSESQACAALWSYITAPMPPTVRLTRAEIESRARSAASAFADLRARLANVGVGGLITNLAVGVPYDRIGALDGLYLFGWGTPWEHRSLPPTATGTGSALVTLAALQPVEVQAEIVGPWFGQPGGGIRFHVEGGVSIRDLVRSGALAVVDILD